MAGAPKGETAIVHCPHGVHGVDYVRPLGYLYGKRVVMRRLTFLVAEDLNWNFKHFHSRH
jgi:hypothetical protein